MALSKMNNLYSSYTSTCELNSSLMTNTLELGFMN